MTSVQNEIPIFFEELNGKGFRVVSTNEVAVYFVNGKEVFPFLKLCSVLDNFGIEFFGNAVECEAVIGGEDELLFQPETFLEFFDVSKEVYDLCGDGVNEFRCFKPIVTIG